MSKAEDISLGRETALSTLARFIMAASGFAGTILFARYLGRASFGGVYLLFGLVKILDRPMVGFAGAGQKRISEHDGVKDEAFTTQMGFNLGWITLVGLGTVVLTEQLRGYTRLEAAPIFLLTVMITQSVYETLDRHIKGRGKVSVATWVDTVRSYLTLPLQVALVLLGLGAAGMVYGLVGATAVSLPIIFYYLEARPALPSRETLSSLWAYARYNIPTSALSTVTIELDMLLLGILLAPGPAADYRVAWAITLPATYLAQVATTGLLSKVSGRSVRGKDVSEDVSNTIAYASVLAVPMFFGGTALATQLVVTLYGETYVGATHLLVGLAAYRIIATQTLTLQAVTDGMDRPDLTLRLTAATLVLNVVLGVALTLRFGPIGVVVGTLLAESVRYVGFAKATRSLVPDFDLLPRPLLEQFAAGLTMFAVVVVAHSYVPVKSWVDLVGLVGLGAAVYTTSLLALSTHFRATVRNVVLDVV